MNTHSILIVDDEPDNFDVLESLLPDENYRLHYAISGENAIASLDKFDPDVILLDVMMPGIDGVEVCKRIKAMPEWKSVPIVMVTALSGKKDLSRCLAAGADDFVNKPVNGVELRARVNSMLRIKKQHDQIQSFSKLQRHNINSLNKNLNEIRLNLAAEFSRELYHPLDTILDTILDTTEQLSKNIELLSIPAIRNILSQNNRSTLQLRKLMQKFCFYIHLVVEKPEYHHRDSLSPKSIVKQSLLNQLKEVTKPSNLICEIEDVKLAIDSNHFQWICNESIEHILQKASSSVLTRISGETVGDTFHLSLSTSYKSGSNSSITEMTKPIQMDLSAGKEQELEIGLKIVKKLVNNYDGTFLLSNANEEETTVYLILPLVPDRLPLKESELKTSTISTYN